MIFRFLSNFNNWKKNNKKLKNLTNKIYQIKLKKKGLYIIKRFAILEKTNAFEIKIKEKTENHLKNIEDALREQKNNLLILIQKAEEKLKYENKKKIQTKLELDKIVLKGVSALNMKALLLSQNSLNGIILLI
jgi:endo-alpha-1,4-polygalactosaminidase (GH114 family)